MFVKSRSKTICALRGWNFLIRDDGGGKQKHHNSHIIVHRKAAPVEEVKAAGAKEEEELVSNCSGSRLHQPMILISAI